MRHRMTFFTTGAMFLSTAAAYVDLSDEFSKLLPDNSAAVDEFGFASAINGDTAIIGAFRDDDNGTNSGSAYLFCAASSLADRNEDDFLHTLYCICFLNQYNTSDPAADCDGDGIVNTLNFPCFLNASSEGC